MWGNIAIALLLAFITAYVITPYTMRLAKKIGAVDIPAKRRIHKEPTPRLRWTSSNCRIFIICNIPYNNFKNRKCY